MLNATNSTNFENRTGRSNKKLFHVKIKEKYRVESIKRKFIRATNYYKKHSTFNVYFCICASTDF